MLELSMSRSVLEPGEMLGEVAAGDGGEIGLAACGEVFGEIAQVAPVGLDGVGGQAALDAAEGLELGAGALEGAGVWCGLGGVGVAAGRSRRGHGRESWALGGRRPTTETRRGAAGHPGEEEKTAPGGELGAVEVLRIL